MITLLKILPEKWEQAKGYLRLDLEAIEAAMNQRWSTTFGASNLLNPETIQGWTDTQTRYVSNEATDPESGWPMWAQVNLSNGVKNRLPFSNLVAATLPSVLVGRRSGSAGDFEQISLGPGLAMQNTTLSVELSSIRGAIPIPDVPYPDDPWPLFPPSTAVTTLPGGSDTQVQFNDGGVFGGDAGLTYNKATDALTVAGQLIISGASAGQIVFPATQNPSSNANTLDDYEEGTWTPVVTFETPGDLSITYDRQLGRYTKIGNIVTVVCSIDSATFTHTTAADDLQVTGLPFATANITGLRVVGPLSFNNFTKAGYTVFVADVIHNSTIVTFFASASASSASKVSAANTPTGGELILNFTLTYRVD